LDQGILRGAVAAQRRARERAEGVLEFDKAGGEVGLVCTDGDSTYVLKVGSRFALLAARENYHRELPVHMQGDSREDHHH
jgi:hypothetical protein